MFVYPKQLFSADEQMLQIQESELNTLSLLVLLMPHTPDPRSARGCVCVRARALDPDQLGSRPSAAGEASIFVKEN